LDLVDLHGLASRGQRHAELGAGAGHQELAERRGGLRHLAGAEILVRFVVARAFLRLAAAAAATGATAAFGPFSFGAFAAFRVALAVRAVVLFAGGFVGCRRALRLERLELEEAIEAVGERLLLVRRLR